MSACIIGEKGGGAQVKNAEKLSEPNKRKVRIML